MGFFYNYLEKLKVDQLYQLAEFVVKENFNHHLNEKVYPIDYLNEVNSVFEEESLYFKNAKIFILKDSNNSLLASIRVLRWDRKQELPIQKIFGIDPLSLKSLDNEETIWHIGRFAIKKGMGDINLFKRMMVCALAPICNDKKSIVYAECDSKLLRVMLSLGIKAIPIGKPIIYLGSETFPIKISYSGIIDFYVRNKFLISRSLSKEGIIFTEFRKQQNIISIRKTTIKGSV